MDCEWCGHEITGNHWRVTVEKVIVEDEDNNCRVVISSKVYHVGHKPI